VTGLVVLAAISLLAVTAAGGMTMQRHQAANFQDLVRARAAADIAQWAALAWLYSRPDSDRQFDCTAPCFLPAAIRPPGTLPPQTAFLPATWWREHATAWSRHPVSGDPAGFDAPDTPDAAWVLEEVHFEAIDPDANAQGIHGIGYYRVLSRGAGRQANTVTVREAIVARPWQGAYRAAPYPPEGPLRAFCEPFDVALPCGVLSWRVLR
jgi:Tfp pilus assembly protein PilX